VTQDLGSRRTLLDKPPEALVDGPSIHRQF
jgi:hypothetical protein